MGGAIGLTSSHTTMSQHEIGNEQTREMYGKERVYRLVQGGPTEFGKNDPDEVVVIEDGDVRHYIRHYEGAKECFGVFMASPDYPLLRFSGTYMDINFFYWLAQREGLLNVQQYDDTPLTEPYCTWKNVEYIE